MYLYGNQYSSLPHCSCFLRQCLSEEEEQLQVVADIISSETMPSSLQGVNYIDFDNNVNEKSFESGVDNSIVNVKRLSKLLAAFFPCQCPLRNEFLAGLEEAVVFVVVEDEEVADSLRLAAAVLHRNVELYLIMIQSV
jgi:hypothetical protein